MRPYQGFGYGVEGEIQGSVGVLEVRPHETIKIYDGQVFFFPHNLVLLAQLHCPLFWIFCLKSFVICGHAAYLSDGLFLQFGIP